MKTGILVNYKGGFVKAATHDFNRVLAVPFCAMKVSRRSASAHCSSEGAGSWVLEMLSGLAWMG